MNDLVHIFFMLRPFSFPKYPKTFLFTLISSCILTLNSGFLNPNPVSYAHLHTHTHKMTHSEKKQTDNSMGGVVCEYIHVGTQKGKKYIMHKLHRATNTAG